MGRIICIGRRATGVDDDTRAVHYIGDWLQRMGRLADVGKRIQSGDLDLYDMSTLPEKGDGIAAIERYRDIDMVLAIHLFGIDFGTGLNSPALYQMTNYYYNRRNWQLLDICRERGVRLIAWGDQPKFHPACYPDVQQTQLVGSCYLYEPEVKHARQRKGTGKVAGRARLRTAKGTQASGVQEPRRARAHHVQLAK